VNDERLTSAALNWTLMSGYRHSASLNRTVLLGSGYSDWQVRTVLFGQGHSAWRNRTLVSGSRTPDTATRRRETVLPAHTSRGRTSSLPRRTAEIRANPRRQAECSGNVAMPSVVWRVAAGRSEISVRRTAADGTNRTRARPCVAGPEPRVVVVRGSGPYARGTVLAGADW